MYNKSIIIKIKIRDLHDCMQTLSKFAIFLLLKYIQGKYSIVYVSIYKVKPIYYVILQITIR